MREGMRPLREGGEERLSEDVTFLLKIWVIPGREQHEQRF